MSDEGPLSERVIPTPREGAPVIPSARELTILQDQFERFCAAIAGRLDQTLKLQRVIATEAQNADARLDQLDAGMRTTLTRIEEFRTRSKRNAERIEQHAEELAKLRKDLQEMGVSMLEAIGKANGAAIEIDKLRKEVTRLREALEEIEEKAENTDQRALATAKKLDDRASKNEDVLFEDAKRGLELARQQEELELKRKAIEVDTAKARAHQQLELDRIEAVDKSKARDRLWILAAKILAPTTLAAITGLVVALMRGC